MSEELQSLLDKINADGIQKAEAESARIIAAAKAEAEKIIAAAKAEADAVNAKAQDNADTLRARALSAAQQAARDIVLQLRAELKNRLNAAISESASVAMTPEFMAGLVSELAGKFAASPEAEISVRCAVKDVEALDAALKKTLFDSVKNNPVLIASPEISAGVQVEFSDEDGFFDFTEAAVTDLLAAYSGEKLAEVFKA